MVLKKFAVCLVVAGQISLSFGYVRVNIDAV